MNLPTHIVNHRYNPGETATAYTYAKAISRYGTDTTQ